MCIKSHPKGAEIPANWQKTIFAVLVVIVKVVDNFGRLNFKSLLAQKASFARLFHHRNTSNLNLMPVFILVFDAGPICGKVKARTVGWVMAGCA